MIRIPESGVEFGDLKADDCYQIEHSQGHQSLGDGFKMVEFTYLREQKLFVVEAKSSIPKASSQPDYDNYWAEILEKFENALLLQVMAYLKRNPSAEQELPTNHTAMDWQHTSLQLRLVIPKVPTQFLPPLTDKFRQSLKRLKTLWCIRDSHIFVLNEDKARSEGLLV
ncbi:hypothetical protein [Pseudoalteromonas viridis]|uniref:Uncharacterized protein n=1 Tax=Pseudoalteromonas viridis TaxID=339617 RepID=A0ABX7V4Z2_9GAMM|nr:hypothetical protein [Pseudoalteromonas viridis]QTL35934.1 hypothetical protein J5X90_02425 [Pseudoalteromonas viridis]